MPGHSADAGQQKPEKRHGKGRAVNQIKNSSYPRQQGTGILDGQEPHLALVARHGGIRAHPDGVEGRPDRGFGSDDDFIFPAFFTVTGS